MIVVRAAQSGHGNCAGCLRGDGAVVGSRVCCNDGLRDPETLAAFDGRRILLTRFLTSVRFEQPSSTCLVNDVSGRNSVKLQADGVNLPPQRIFARERVVAQRTRKVAGLEVYALFVS